jgi:hypothetical protein
VTVTLTPKTDMAPVPRIEIVVNSVDVPAGTDLITIWRISEGREYRVRDGIDRVMVTAVSLVDVEAARGVVSTYEAECWDGSLFLGRVALGSTTLAFVGDDNSLLVQQPLDPALSVEVIKLDGMWPEFIRSTPGDLVYAEGAFVPTYVGFGPRRALEQLTVDIAVASRAAAVALHATLGTYDTPQLPIWLLRGAGGLAPRLLFVRVASLVEIDIDVRMLPVGADADGWSTFRAVVDEVAPPAPAVVSSILSYDDLDAGYASYTAMDAAYASYDAKDRDYTLAGLAP